MPIAICKSHPAVIAISFESCNVHGHEWLVRLRSIISVWNQLTLNLVTMIVDASLTLAFLARGRSSNRVSTHQTK